MTAPDPVVVIDPAEPSGPTRRCWRCLQYFPCDAAEIPRGASEWWLCDPCQNALVGPASHQ